MYPPQRRESSAVWAVCRSCSAYGRIVSAVLPAFSSDFATSLMGACRSTPAISCNLLKTVAFHAIEALLTRFTSIGPDVCGEEDIIREPWPRTTDSGRLTVRALECLAPASRGDCNRRQPPKHDYQTHAYPDIANPHASSSATLNLIEPQCAEIVSLRPDTPDLL